MPAASTVVVVAEFSTTAAAALPAVDPVVALSLGLVFFFSVGCNKTTSGAGGDPCFKTGAESGSIQKRLARHPASGVGMEDIIHKIRELFGPIGPVRSLVRTVARTEEEALQRRDQVVPGKGCVRMPQLYYLYING